MEVLGRRALFVERRREEGCVDCDTIFPHKDHADVGHASLFLLSEMTGTNLSDRFDPLPKRNARAMRSSKVRHLETENVAAGPNKGLVYDFCLN